MLYKLAVFVPESHLEVVKHAVFNAGGGKYKNYDCCSWQTLGMGQFRPREGAQPFLGELEQIEQVEEYKVEFVVAKKYLKEVLIQLKKAHPYEEVAYEVFEMIHISI